MIHPPPANGQLPILVDTVGRVRLGHHPGPAPRCAPLHVVGGIVVVSPFAPDRPPFAEVSAAEAEGAWLPLTYGEDVARAMHAAARTAAGTPVADDAPADHVLARGTAPWLPGSGHTPLARLALLMWIARWAPFRLAPELVEIEAGTLLAALADTIEDAEETARVLLLRRAGDLADVAAAVLDRGVLSGERWVAALLRDALVTASEFAEDLPLAPRLRDLADRADLACDATPDAMDAGLRRLVERQTVYENSDGPSRAAGEYVADVDWAQVPPHVVSSAEGTVRWRLRGSGPDTRIEVGVAADEDGAPPGDGLAFRVYAPAHPLPVAVGVLEHGGSGWRGSARLRGSVDPGHLDVDVFHPAWAAPVRTGAAASLAAGERQAVRELMVLRTHLARDDRRRLVRWAEITSSDADGPLGALGPDPLASRLRGLVRAALAAAGRAPADPFDPCLTAPEWRPTLAEWNRIRPLRAE